MSRRLSRSALLCGALFLLVSLAWGGSSPLDAQGTRFLRQPDVSATQIAFVHANDVWTANRDGGVAVRLTSSEGAETDPAFSPDGQWIAFSGQYGGNTDVYLMPAAGGQPQRLTWHPAADIVQGWTPEGAIMFQSSREGVPTRLWKFYAVSPSGGVPTPLSIPQAYLGQLSDDGGHFAYQEIGYWDPEWRNYRGGQAQPINIVATDNYERTTPPWEGERQMDPVWMDGIVYYLSERDYAANVWSFDPASGTERQVTSHSDFDVKSLGAGDGVVVYEQAGYLHELEPASGQSRTLEIHANGDQNWSRPRWEEVPAQQLRDARLSPTGRRALFEWRGEIFSVPADEGSWRNLTHSPGVADRHAVWSPDGAQIAWFNDAGGEYGLVIADQNGANQRRIEIPDPTFYFVPEWSPDGQRLAFTDTDYRVLIADVASGVVKAVDTDRFAHPERSMNPVWSPDSRWVAYSRRLDNQLRAVFVYNVETEEVQQVTDGMADAITPVWDESGEYLYFLASTDYGLNTGWLDMTSFDRPVTRALYVAVLSADGVSPFLPQSDEEEVPSDEGDTDPEESGDEPIVVIDFAGLNARIVDAPGLPLGNYAGLVRGPSGSVFVLESGDGPGATVHKYSVDKAESQEFLEA